MKLGEVIEITKTCVERGCDECGESARYKHTYLLKGTRSNPASSAYGKDDCSWCEDECSYSCEEHKELVRRNIPDGYVWCSTFSRDRFEHMFLYWEETSKEKILG